MAEEVGDRRSFTNSTFTIRVWNQDRVLLEKCRVAWALKKGITLKTQPLMHEIFDFFIKAHEIKEVLKNVENIEEE